MNQAIESVYEGKVFKDSVKLPNRTDVYTMTLPNMGY